MNQKRSCQSKVRNTLKESIILFRSIPSPVVAFFVVSVISMNILANKTLIQQEYIAIDGGILVSWLSFLSMDIVTKHYGPRASTRMSIFAMLVNLLACLIFYIASVIPTGNNDFEAFNRIIGGTWFILLSSSIAFLCSAIINNVLNFSIGKLFKTNPDGKLAFVTRSYVSTFIGQFFDNFIFSILCFMVFFPIFENFSWTLIQCFTCSLVGAGLELVMEIVFSPFGYMICKKWKEDHVGEDYFKYIEGRNNESIN